MADYYKALLANMSMVQYSVANLPMENCNKALLANISNSVMSDVEWVCRVPEWMMTSAK